MDPEAPPPAASHKSEILNRQCCMNRRSAPLCRCTYGEQACSERRWPPPPRDGRPHLRKAVVYNGRLTGKKFTSALSQEMLSEPLQRTSRRTSKVSSKVYVRISRSSRAPALVDIRRAFVSVLGDSRFTERVARARPWTGVANESSSCASGGTVPRRQETAAQEPRGR